VDVSPWAYPFLLTVHGLGMAVVVGLTVVIGLRILGFPAKVPLSAYQALMPILLIAFAFNAASGVVLYTTDAMQLTANRSFQIKMVSIVLGCILLWRLNKVVLAPAAQSGTVNADGQLVDGYTPTAGAKTLAIVVMLIWWLSVIVSGRLVAYLSASV
jgi:hypothetical protein